MKKFVESEKKFNFICANQKRKKSDGIMKCKQGHLVSMNTTKFYPHIEKGKIFLFTQNFISIWKIFLMLAHHQDCLVCKRGKR